MTSNTLRASSILLLLLSQTGLSMANHSSVPAFVVGAPVSDPANIRKWPSTTSMVVATETNGNYIDLTGRCKDIVTNAPFFINTSKSPNWNYARTKKPNMWCQLNMFNQHFWVRGSLVKIN